MLAIGGLGPGLARAQLGTFMRQPQGLAHAGIYSVRELDPSLDGSGVQFALIARSLTYADDGLPENDYQPLLRHSCFQDTVLLTLDNGLKPSRVSPHSTAVCSILFGRDPVAQHAEFGAFAYEGAVPGAEVQIFEFNYFMESRIFRFLSQGTLTREELGADVISLSCGHDEESWWTRGLEKLVDHRGAIVVGSIGNGIEAEHPLLYPGAAANLIGVGVVDSVRSRDPMVKAAYFGLAYPEHSSCGPTRDNRCKPDLVAPGNCLVADAVNETRYDLPGNWSSYAAPVVAGIAGQLVQKAKDTPHLETAVSAEAGGRVIKAILMNSATKLPHWHKGRLTPDDDPFVPLDYVQGAGLANAVEAYQQLVAGRQQPGVVQRRGWDLNTLDTERNVARAYRFTLRDLQEATVTCTVVWNRRYEDPLNLESVEQSDLRLELWAVSPTDRTQKKLVNHSDSAVDNVEHIHFRTTSGYRQYELVVILNEPSMSTDTVEERYAISWSALVADSAHDILPEDLNSDGIVDDQDLAMLAAYRQIQRESDAAYAIGDMNTDGILDDADADHIKRHNATQALWYTP
jgi:hypothetical protein